MPIPDLPTPTGGETYDVNQKPPPFGHPLKYYFALDDDYINLNHGSYGTLPLPLVFATARMGYEIERNPDKYHRLVLRPGLLEKARESLAKFLEVETDEVVLVPNATHALNTVLRNFEWREGDVLIGATTTYDAVSNTIRYLADRSEQPRPEAVTIAYNFPLTHAQIVNIFRATLREIKQQHSGTSFTDVPPLSPGYVAPAHPADPPRGNKIVAVIDSIVANPGVFMPWKEMVRICREEGVWTVIDAAHSIGQEPDINLTESKPDFWLSNRHKWLYAKRGCAVLYVPRRNQYIIKSSIPTSHNYLPPTDPEAKVKGTDFAKQHEWTGTADTVPFVTIPDALAFRHWLGGEKVINDYCHKLALEGGKRLAEVMGTQVMDETGELTLNMVSMRVLRLSSRGYELSDRRSKSDSSTDIAYRAQSNVALPLPAEKTPGEVYTREQLHKINLHLRHKLLNEWNAYAAHYFHAGRWWCRCSAQVFNEISDFEYLGKAFDAICKEVEETILSESSDGRSKRD
ncbi:PLP-dependent transferase [Cubamyces lactineus]|nr:PLP-dependent transferase [Cubamyces lactineus]